MKAKNKLRKDMMDLRNNVNAKDKRLRDEIIFEKIIYDKTFLKAKNIFTFVSFKNEVDTHKLIKYALAQGKTVCVPKVNNTNKTMEAIEINYFDELRKSNYGILEPVLKDNKISAEKIDLVLVPGLAFDKNGGRVGYGGGYYDKFLWNKNMTAMKVGVCYRFQVINLVPIDEHDVLLDGLITD